MELSSWHWLQSSGTSSSDRLSGHIDKSLFIQSGGPIHLNFQDFAFISPLLRLLSLCNVCTVCFQSVFTNRSTGFLFISLLHYLFVHAVSLSMVLMFGLHSPVVWLPLAAVPALCSKLHTITSAASGQLVLVVPFCLSLRKITSPLSALAQAAESNRN